MDAADFLYDTAWGPVYGLFSNTGLRELRLPNPAAPLRPYLLHSRTNRVLGRRLGQLLDGYFAGVRVDFAEIPFDPSAGTPFQRRVWDAARGIPFGAARTYGELAASIGAPGAARAVGSALGANPACIVVPCHRIIAADGGLGGFSTGLDWKRRLLALEGVAVRG